MLCMLNAKIKDVILVGLKSETNRIWSEQELNEKPAWAFQHPHNEKERRKIRIDIADEIEEILANEGFVRCRTTFFRANGDNLLQYISVRCYGMYGQPEIDVELEPLYNVFDFVRHTMNEMVTDEGIEGESIETLQNIHIHPVYNSYLAHKDDYMSEMKKEKEILSKVIRNLNEIDNLKKYDAWFEKNVERIDGEYLVRLPYLLVYREYEKACKIMTQYRLEEEHAYEKIQKEYKCEFDRIKEMLPVRFKTYKEFGKLISAINEKNDDKIMEILNQWKTESYNAIEKRSKMFIRKYPMVLFHY